MNKVIDKSNIVCVNLTNENVLCYEKMLDSFDSRDSSINAVIKNRPNIFLEKGEKYDNRDVVYLYLYEDPKTGIRDLIAYISCAASSLSARFDGEMVVVPTIVINTFAVSRRYTNKSGILVSDGNSEYKCSVFIMNHFLDMMNRLSYKVGFTQVYLFAQQKRPVVDFYINDCKFTQIKAGDRVFGEPQGSHEYTLLYSLDNGKYRFQSVM